jgi:hypothetical protein
MIDPVTDPRRRRPLGSAIHRLLVSLVLVAVISGTGLAQESPVEVVDRPATVPAHHHAAAAAKKHHHKSKAHRKHKARRKARKSHKHHRKTHRHHKAKPAPAAE